MRRLLFVGLCLLFALAAQGQTVTISAANLQIDPAGSDSYLIRGSFSGISFGGAKLVLLSVGQFQASILMTDLVQQPGANIFVYQDRSGQAPYWLSSLALDLDAQTFTAQATGITLAGLPNPFAIQFGNESAYGCVMARVRVRARRRVMRVRAAAAADAVTFQLAAGDGVNEPCQVPSPPQVSQPSFFAGQPIDIQFHVAILPTPNLDPASVRLFAADENARPRGAPLCTLRDSGAAADGDAVAGDNVYSCIVPFSQDAPGPIPLLVQATAGADTLLSPGFSVLAVGPMTQSDVDAYGAVTAAAAAAWEENFAAYGDAPQARIKTIGALAGMDGVQDVRLLEDGLSIGVQLTSGVRHALVLNRIGDPSVLPLNRVVGTAPRAVGETAGGPAPRAAGAAPTCNSPHRPIVKNNSVMIWDSGFFSEPNISSTASDKFTAINCPGFDVHRVPASVNNAANFANYGTVIIETHGGIWGADEFLLTSDTVPKGLAPGDPAWQPAQTQGIFSSYIHKGGANYWALTPLFFQSHGPFQRTLTFNAACYGARSSALGGVMAANGGAYFGFTDETSAPNAAGISVPGFALTVEPKLLDDLLKNYLTVADAYQNEPQTDPSVLASISKFFHVPLSSVKARFALLTDPSNTLAYLGNPQLVLTSIAPPVAGSQLLAAYLEGAVNCAANGPNYLAVQWTNSATAGHLTSPGKPLSGSQDNFTNQANCSEAIAACGSRADVLLGSTPPTVVSNWALGQYAPDGSLPGATDNIMADFYPDPAGAAAARGCLTVQGKAGLFVSAQLATVWDDSQPALRNYEASLDPPVKVEPAAAYTVPFSDPCNCAVKGGATASVSVTSNGPGSWTLTIQAGGANPNYAANKTVGSGLGPYHGLSQISLIAVNPGPAGKAMVTIDGKLSNTPFYQNVGYPQPLVTAPGGTVAVVDTQGNKLLSGTLDPGDPTALKSSFSVSGDSSKCAGQSNPYCGIGISVSLGEDLVGAPSPVAFSVTLNIQFLNQ